MYLVAGMVARSVAGPGVVFSFIIAAIASIFSGEYRASSECRKIKERKKKGQRRADRYDVADTAEYVRVYFERLIYI